MCDDSYTATVASIFGAGAQPPPRGSPGQRLTCHGFVLGFCPDFCNGFFSGFISKLSGLRIAGAWYHKAARRWTDARPGLRNLVLFCLVSVREAAGEAGAL